MSYKLLSLYKENPAFIDTKTIRSPKGVDEHVAFAYRDIEDAITNPKQGISSELELAIKFKKSQMVTIEDFFTNIGIIGSYKDASRFNSDKREFITSPIMFKQSVINAFLSGIAGNCSSLISGVDIDGTISGEEGGPEIKFGPVSLAALPLLKPDIERLLHYAKLVGASAETDDTSIHYHVNYGYLGSSTDEVEQTVSNMLWFLFDNREWMREFTGRNGDGEDLANMNYFLGNLDGSLSDSGLKKRFLHTKASILDIIRSCGSIGREIRDKEVSHDDRVKGFFNIVLNDKFSTLEFRWFGSTTDWKTYMLQYEFMYAWVNASKGNYLLANSEITSMERFKEYVKLHKAEFPLLAVHFDPTAEVAPYASIPVEDLLRFEYDGILDIPTEFEDDVEEEEDEDEEYLDEDEENDEEDEEVDDIPELDNIEDYQKRYREYLKEKHGFKADRIFCDECSDAFHTHQLMHQYINYSCGWKKTEFKALCKTCYDKKILIGAIDVSDEQQCPISLTRGDIADFIEDIAGFPIMSLDGAKALEDFGLLEETETEKLLELL